MHGKPFSCDAFFEADFTDLETYRANKSNFEQGAKPTFILFFVKALVPVLKAPHIRFHCPKMWLKDYKHGDIDTPGD